MTIRAPSKLSVTHRRVPASARSHTIVQALKDDGFAINGGFISPEQAIRLNEDVQGYTQNHSYITKPVNKNLFGRLAAGHLNRASARNSTPRSMRDWIGCLTSVLGRESSSGIAMVLSLPCNPLFGTKPLFMMIIFLLASLETTYKNDATPFYPGSYKWDISQGEYTEPPIVAELRPGDACLLGWNTVHVGGSNGADEVL
ncbi:hypothetical protein BBP40_008643 [Aspergillus hancockii]|nr:hypothetical protein BBP40_008643 [Aspergillus hancockii]